MNRPVGPYTPVIRSGDWLAVSGQIAQVDGVLIDGGIEEQTRKVFENLTAVLGTKGSGLVDIVKTNVFLTDMNDYAAFNAVYVECFGEHRPARCCVGVSALPLGATVEIEAWAFIGQA